MVLDLFSLLAFVKRHKPALWGQGGGWGIAVLAAGRPTRHTTRHRAGGLASLCSSGRDLVGALRGVQRQQRNLLQPLRPLPAHPQVAPPPRRQRLQQPLQARRAPQAALLGRPGRPPVLGLLPAWAASRAPREEPPPAPAARAGAAVPGGRAPARRLGLPPLRAAPLQARYRLQQLVPPAAAPGAPEPQVRHSQPRPLLLLGARRAPGRGPSLANGRAGQLGGGLQDTKSLRFRPQVPFCHFPGGCAPSPSQVARETRMVTAQCPSESILPSRYRVQTCTLSS